MEYKHSGVVDHGSHDEPGQEGKTGLASNQNTDFQPGDFEVTPGLGLLPPIFVPLSPEAEQWRPSSLAWHALMRILNRLRTMALAHYLRLMVNEWDTSSK